MWLSRIPAVAGVFRSAALPEADMVRASALAWCGVNARRARNARVKIVDKIGGGKTGNNFDRIVIARLRSAMRAQSSTAFIERMYPPKHQSE